MKHLEIYFSKNGISSSQANHVANLIKEKNKVVESELNNTAAYTETLFKDGEYFILKNPIRVNLLLLSQKEGEFYALSSWLREAIKARDALLTYYRQCPGTEFGALPQALELKPPVKLTFTQPVKATEADILANFSIKELAEYWSLEAKAAHIGKRIHKGGVVSNIREEILANKDSVTTFTVMDGKHYPIQFSKVYDFNNITETFDKLQKLHREFESKLNFYKAKIQNGMSELDAKRQGEFKSVQESANLKYNTEIIDYNNAVRNYNESVAVQNAANEEARANKLREVSAWKIAIPDELLPIYQQFSE